MLRDRRGDVRRAIGNILQNLEKRKEEVVANKSDVLPLKISLLNRAGGKAKIR